MRAVVIGASSGLGRCIGIGLAQRGAQVALLARRRQRLDDAAKEAGPGTLAIECDVTDEGSCQAAIAEAADGLGGIDGLVYAPAVSRLSRIEETSAATWHEVLSTNVVGASLATAAALPHLRESRGTAILMTSNSASLTPPWPGLGAYTVSKSALDKLVEVWRAEHPDVAFTRLVVGECAGGEGDAMTGQIEGWDLELAGEMHPIWMERKLMSGFLLDVEQLVVTVDMVLNSHTSAYLPSVAVVPRPTPS